ncbi:MAG: division/cell wall cluster transcriptional repressor MraZ [Paraprevotella sp.]|nr:division/cell wall cluster transcriptional repressor MraZ [Paraprevotella sp.]
MRFTGNIDAKTDAKGRVFLPAAFRKVLQGSGEEGLILRRDVFQRCLVLYPETVWNGLIDELTRRTHPFDRKGRELLRRFVADAERITTDGNGRLLLPKRYLLSAGITADVRFIGMDDTIEIWSREEAKLLLEDNGDLGDGLEAMMGMATGQPDAIHE